MCLGAIGSQTGGSINRPASYCGVAGLKPSYGMLSCQGIVPLAPSMDHPGPMARCVRDLALLLQVMGAGAFMMDAMPNFQTLLDGEMMPPKLGRVRGLFEDLAEPTVRNMMDDVCLKLTAVMKVRRYVEPIAEVALPAGFGTVLADHKIVMAVEAAEFHGDRLRRHPDDYPPRIRGLIEEGLACPAPEYLRCQDQQRRLAQEMHNYFSPDALLGRRLHALIMPATTSPAPLADTTGNPAFNSPWSYSHFPSLSFATGHFVDGLPLAVQLVGDRDRETDLFKAALWCEQALGVKPLTV
jgi:Asp-tRNA(Asn)/Glu-tRNA(Gln) amidotransferase A subunit family amidase